jgi:hypothetical protein
MVRVLFWAPKFTNKLLFLLHFWQGGTICGLAPELRKPLPTSLRWILPNRRSEDRVSGHFPSVLEAQCPHGVTYVQRHHAAIPLASAGYEKASSSAFAIDSRVR